VIFVGFSLVLTVLVVRTAEASLVNPQAQAVKDFNSQSISLLESVPVANPKLAEASLTKARVDGEALVADNNLSGIGGPEVVTPESDEISMYVVQDGDTLEDVAKMFNVSANTIKWANNISKLPEVGEVLVILPITGVKHVAKKGDDLESLAKKYNSQAKEIAQYNGLDFDADLGIGDEIIIPNGQIAPPKPKPKPKPKSATTPKKTTPKAVPAPGLPSYGGYYMRPISGGVRTQGIHGNNGVDLANQVGTPIYASAGGRVIVAKSSGWNGGYGNYVVIAHDNGTQSLYGHMNTVGVSVGQVVTKGVVVGTLGSSGNSTGPHIHFEIRGGVNPF